MLYFSFSFIENSCLLAVWFLKVGSNSYHYVASITIISINVLAKKVQTIGWMVDWLNHANYNTIKYINLLLRIFPNAFLFSQVDWILDKWIYPVFPIRIRIPRSGSPDPYRNEADPKHWIYLLCRLRRLLGTCSPPCLGTTSPSSAASCSCSVTTSGSTQPA